MFAVVEFPNKSHAIIPYAWLREGHDKCYWPSTKTEDAFTKLVQSCATPNSAWSIYAVKKVVYTGEDYELANDELDNILNRETGSSSDDIRNGTRSRTREVNNIHQNNRGKVLSSGKENPDLGEYNQTRETNINKQLSDDGNNGSFDKRQKQISPQPQVNVFNDDDFPRGKQKPDLQMGETSRKKKLPYNNQDPAKRLKRDSQRNDASTSHHSDTSWASDDIDNNLNAASINSASTETFIEQRSFSTNITNQSEDSHSFLNSCEILPKIFQLLQQLKATTDQHSIMLADLSRQMRTQGSLMMERPADMPELPVENKSSFYKLENWLKVEENFLYLKRRLAAVGGETVRLAITQMLRFLLTNKVARKFNWAGREKKPFKTTNMMKVLEDAVLYLFRDSAPSDLTSKNVKSAVQDWLKLAPQRYNYQKNKRLIIN